MKAQTILMGIALAMCLFAVSCNNKPAGNGERNRALLLKANEELLAKKNAAYADEAFAVDYTFSGIDMKGPELIKSYLDQLKTAFPDLQYTVEPTIVEGNLVAWSRKMTGTHKGDFMGYKATGMPMTWTETNITRFADDGKIAQEWGTTDFDVVASRLTNLDGVYEYLDGTKGRAILRNGTYVFAFGPASSRELNAEAGTYSISNGIITNNIKYSNDPKRVGTSFSWKVKSWSGDTATYAVLNDTGETAGEGRALRISY